MSLLEVVAFLFYIWVIYLASFFKHTSVSSRIIFYKRKIVIKKIDTFTRLLKLYLKSGHFMKNSNPQLYYSMLF